VGQGWTEYPGYEADDNVGDQSKGRCQKGCQEDAEQSDAQWDEERWSSMMQRIAVGIHPDSSYSAQVLDQLGIPSVPVENLENGISLGVRVFLWNRSYDTDEPKSASGKRVAIITDNGFLRPVARGTNEPTTRSYYFKLPQNPPFAAQSFYVNLPVSPTQGKSFGACYDRDNNEISNSGIGIIEKSNRLIVSLPWDICGYEQGVNWQHRPYFSPTANKHFVEVGPTLDTGAFRHLLLNILFYCFNWLELPLVRVSPFYKNKQYFSFRIDADGFTESSTKAALRVAQKSGLRFTWFIDTASWRHEKKWISHLKECNQDVQFHCFRHMTYASQEVNDINVQKGLKILRDNGVTPNAIVSPLGYNYRGFSEAIKEHGFVYSSEFGYAVDDLPSNPWNDKNYPLQIPVHPACSGVLGQAGFSRQEQFDHLFDVVGRRCNADGICILYDHPKGGLETHEAQYMDLFNRLSNSLYEYICMSDYYRVWIERHQNPTILYDQDLIQVDGFRDNGFRLEQVTNGAIKAVRWENATLPQVRAEEFCYPPDWIQELACKKRLLNLKQRNFSKSAWYLNEMYMALGSKSGCYWCRRRLARVKWLRELRERMRK
jgi:hypothetical protein